MINRNDKGLCMCMRVCARVRTCIRVRARVTGSLPSCPSNSSSRVTGVPRTSWSSGPYGETNSKKSQCSIKGLNTRQSLDVC